MSELEFLPDQSILCIRGNTQESVENAKSMVFSIIKAREEEYSERMLEKSTSDEIQPTAPEERVIPGFTNKQKRQPKPLNSSVVKPVETSFESTAPIQPEKSFADVAVQNHSEWTPVPFKGRHAQDDTSKKKKGKMTTLESHPEIISPIETALTPADLMESKIIKVESKKSKKPQLMGDMQEIVQKAHVQAPKTVPLPKRPPTPVEEEVVDEWVEVNPGRKSVKPFTPVSQNQLKGISISNNSLNLISTDPLPKKKKNKKKKKVQDD